jgi:hypothetical protein
LVATTARRAISFGEECRLKTYIIRFWVNDKRVKPSMRVIAQDIRDATGKLYALLNHPELKYISEDGSVEVRLQTSHITDYVLFVKDDDSVAG